MSAENESDPRWAVLTPDHYTQAMVFADEQRRLFANAWQPVGLVDRLTQHQDYICADVAVRAAVARSQLLYAACALDAGQDDAAFHVASAKHLADQAAIDNGRANIQVHGGIGMTDEAYPHFCLKRAHLLSFIAPARRELILGEAA